MVIIILLPVNNSVPKNITSDKATENESAESSFAPGLCADVKIAPTVNDTRTPSPIKAPAKTDDTQYFEGFFFIILTF